MFVFVSLYEMQGAQNITESAVKKRVLHFRKMLFVLQSGFIVYKYTAKVPPTQFYGNFSCLFLGLTQAAT